MPLSDTILMTQENQEIFKGSLNQPSYIQENNINSPKQYLVDKDSLVLIITKALEVYKKSRPNRDTKNTFPANPWFDDECKMAIRSMRGKMNKENTKEYEKLLRRKKEQYVDLRRLLVNLAKNNPKIF